MEKEQSNGTSRSLRGIVCHTQKRVDRDGMMPGRIVFALRAALSGTIHVYEGAFQLRDTIGQPFTDLRPEICTIFECHLFVEFYASSRKFRPQNLEARFFFDMKRCEQRRRQPRRLLRDLNGIGLWRLPFRKYVDNTMVIA